MSGTVIGWILLCLLTASLTHAQSVTPQLDSALRTVGRMITADGTKRVGTAFVAGETFNIFTVAHVAVQDTMLFAPYGTDYTYRVVLKYALSDFDLAIYRRTGGVEPRSLRLGDIKRIQPGDTILYVGWDDDTHVAIRPSVVSAKGAAAHKKEIVDFIDFQGEGIPGYSGGPVLNDKFEVVGIIVQGWDVSSMKGVKLQRIHRAFSIDLLRIIEQRVKISTEVDSTGQVPTMRLEEAK